MVLPEKYQHFSDTTDKIICYLKYGIEIMNDMKEAHGDGCVSITVFLKHSIRLLIFDENSNHSLTCPRQSVFDLSHLHFLFPSQSIVSRK